MRAPLAILLALTLAMLSSGCAASDPVVDIGTTTSPGVADADVPEDVVAVSSEQSGTAVVTGVDWDSDDLDAGWDGASATHIELRGDEIIVEGRGVDVGGAVATIRSGGTYVVSGALNDGQLRVNAPDDKTVRIVLDGADITCTSGPAMYILNADKTIVTLAKGKANRVEDGVSYELEEQDATEPNAAIFSHDDLTINGSGSLTVIANYDNGIQSKDDLRLVSGTVTITAVNDAIKGKDSVAIRDGIITVDAGGDGVQSSNDADASKGFVWIEGGVLDITSALDGIQAETCIVVSGGAISIVSGGGSATGSTETDRPGNPWGGKQEGNASSQSAVSTKGLKSRVDIAITGGVIAIDSFDDAIHSNGSITVKGGVIEVSSGDDGMHADASVTMDGGDLRVSRSYEGLESAVITVNGGSIRVVSGDDGFNVCGDNDRSLVGERPGQSALVASAARYLEINDGYVVIDSDGDGLDVNGSIAMSGGVVIINGPTFTANGALDYYQSFTISGGLLVAVGSSSMVQAPSASSTQNSAMVNLTASQEAGTLIHIETEDGTDLLTFMPAKTYQSIVFSAPDLESGTTCLVAIGGEASGTETDGLYVGGEYSGGAEFSSFTVSSAVTRVGSAAGGRPGGGMAPPGIRP